MPSSSLIPDDPTTLFTGSGMQPLLPYFLGAPHPMGKRVADSQRCFRAQDIEEVGDNRHTVFFEMLGNWSFGDYFKKEQVSWMFQFLTEDIGLDPKRIYFTCFRGNEALGIPKDEETALLWQKLLKERNIDSEIVDFPEKNGMQNARIFYYDEKKNWWSRFGSPDAMPIDEPGGPDSEMFWDFGEKQNLHEKSPWRDLPCHVNCDCGRFMEIGNNVFMEYVKTVNGFEKLKQKNVDFGGGLERLTAAWNDNPDMFAIDLFLPLTKELERVTGKSYRDEAKSFRIITDHIRASVFLIADGIRPSNVDRGYILRRLLRRAARYAFLLGLKTGWHEVLVGTVSQMYRDSYPEVAKEKEISEVVSLEYEKFERALERGIREFQRLAPVGKISGTEAFNLYQTYGFPIELIEELAAEKGIELDRAGFNREFTSHQEISRKGVEKKFGGHGLLLDTGELKAGDATELNKVTRLHTATHLLNSALHQVLGPAESGIEQRGSDITVERARFDFRFPRKVEAEELKRIEKIVNAAIAENLPVSSEEMDLEEAKNSGALYFAQGRYPSRVKVYTIGRDEEVISKELCGGPHVSSTGEIGKFRIIKEESSSAGVRRIRVAVEP